MTEQEKLELNRRVAGVLGWRWVRLDFAESSFGDAPRTTVRFLGPGFKALPTVKVAYLDEMPEIHDEDFKLMPHYCTDPTDADLVRQEIESRGWVWSIGPHMSANEGSEKYFSVASGGSYRCSKPPYGMSGGATWTEALCRAFLSAIAESENSQEAKP